MLLFYVVLLIQFEPLPVNTSSSYRSPVSVYMQVNKIISFILYIPFFKTANHTAKNNMIKTPSNRYISVNLWSKMIVVRKEQSMSLYRT